MGDNISTMVCQIMTENEVGINGVSATVSQ
jgi:hypothetical protein